MIRYRKEYIQALLDKYMDGETTLEEEDILASYFRGGDEATARDPPPLDGLECGGSGSSGRCAVSCHTVPTGRATSDKAVSGTGRYDKGIRGTGP